MGSGGARMLALRTTINSTTYEISRMLGAATQGFYAGIIDTNRPLIMAIIELIRNQQQRRD
jgi:hypothetical protein